MEHIETIQALIKTLLISDSFHSLIVEGPPGMGKSSALQSALARLLVKAVPMGSYATPLHIYRTLCQHPSSLLILDDCYGALSDPKAMTLLKAATWSAGDEEVSSSPPKGRRVSWGTSSEKVEMPHCDFSGKMILLTNAIPSGKDTEAFLSRCLSYRIQLSETEVREILLKGAKSKVHFADGRLARQVAEFIVEKRTGVDLSQVNLRTLKLGYDLAGSHPDSWRSLFLKLLPRRNGVEESVKELLKSGLSAKAQEAKFFALTGKSRRTYYVYKRQLGLSRGYRIETGDPSRSRPKGSSPS